MLSVLFVKKGEQNERREVKTRIERKERKERKEGGKTYRNKIPLSYFRNSLHRACIRWYEEISFTVDQKLLTCFTKEREREREREEYCRNLEKRRSKKHYSSWYHYVFVRTVWVQGVGWEGMSLYLGWIIFELQGSMVAKESEGRSCLDGGKDGEEKATWWETGE